MSRTDDDRRDDAARPDELELMAYYDGELSPERTRAVERWLEAEEAAFEDTYAQLADGFDLVGRVVRDDGGRAAAMAPSVADAVMARIAAERPEAVQTPLTVVTPVTPVAAGVDAWQRVSATQPRNKRRTVRQLVAAVGVLAAAAACTLVVLAGQPDAPIGEEPPVPAMLVATAPAPTVPDPDAAGVAVDTVDFGAKVGTIFLQRGDAASATTVVWIKDDEARP